MKKGITTEIEDSLKKRKDIEQITGSHCGKGLCIGIVVSRYNNELTNGLLDSVISCLINHELEKDRIKVYWVPGALEIPCMINILSELNAYDAFIALGAILEGKTNHADIISSEIAHSLSALSIKIHKPIIQTVVAAHTLQEAAERCLSGKKSRGWYAALAAIEMCTLKHNIF